MLVDIGYYLLFGSALLALWAAGGFLAGGVLRQDSWTRSGLRALVGTLLAVAFASSALIQASLSGDYSVAYIAEVTNRALPTLFRFTAFWAGMDGSMLFWLLVLTTYSTVAVLGARRSHPQLLPWIGLTLSVVVLFFATTVAFMTNPLERLAFTPADGRGMNPSLQNYWMAIHPPTLYLGYIGLAVPFAFAVAALVTGRLGEDWIRATRRWVLWAWACLGIGMIFGGHWAYIELGWGGYWAWDPVENASFLPWLAATAFLHSVMVQERRGMFRAWNLILVMTAFALSIFGTFLTRSGVVESVHSFARSPVGPVFLGFVIAIVGVSAALIYYRWPLLASVHRIDSLLSREFAFMLNNLALMGICVVTLFLTMYPSLSEWATGERWTVGASAFNEINGTLGLLLLVLTGIGPVIAWRRASARSLARSLARPTLVGVIVAAALFAAGFHEPMSLAAWGGAAFVFWCILAEFHAGARVVGAHRGTGYLGGLAGLFSRNRRRYGGYVVHLGIAVFFIGIAGLTFRLEAEASLLPGETVSLKGYEITHAGNGSYRTAGADVHRVMLEVRKGGRLVTSLGPEFKIHHAFPEPEKDVAILETVSGDLYTILAQPLEAGTDRAKVQVLWNPLVAWVWAASWIVLAGTIVCAWPESRRRAVAVPRALAA